MNQFIYENQNLVRTMVFIGILVLMALWEMAHPKKLLTQPKVYRWLNNLGLVILNTLLLPFTLPILAVGAAALAQQNSVGLFNLWTFPDWVVITVSIILLDLCIYWQHRIFHQIPLLWRLHRVHHADQDIDVTTGARFHFIEIWISMLIKVLLITSLGIPAVAVIIFEVLLNGCAMFNHSNIKLPQRIDKGIRMVLVTPDMHRVHHSIYRYETDGNYGFCLSIWDKIFSSYIDQPKDGHQNMQIGISLFRQPREQSLWKMLTQPFRLK